MTTAEQLQRIRQSFPPALSGAALHQAISAVLHKHLAPGVRYFLFGSEAAGSAWRSSDIDIGLWGNAPVPAVVIENIREELDRLPTLRLFDVVDFAEVSPDFREQAIKTAVYLDEQP
jgi:predicted nucleotidyltransferase